MNVVVAGLGVQSAIGNDVDEFTAALRDGVSGVSFEPPGDGLPASLGVQARITRTPEAGGRIARSLRRSRRAKQISLLAAAEAWTRSGLAEAHDRGTTGMVVAVAGAAQGLAYETGWKHRSTSVVRPGYACEVWESDLLGVASELFGIHGEGLVVGGASAAGNVGLVHGYRMIRHGYADVCLVLAPMTELSPVERMALYNLGALGAKSTQEPAETLSRPFDAGHDGFIPGEGAAALVLESAAHAAARGAAPLARIHSAVIGLQGEHGTAPSADTQVRVMNRALYEAGLDAARIDYVNAHATSTPAGDAAEAEALSRVLGDHARTAWVNSTKSLTGHCLGPASAIEAVASVQQIRHGFVHPNLNLKEPITEALNLAPSHSVPAQLTYAMSNGFAFGGINTCVVLGAASTAGRDQP